MKIQPSLLEVAPRFMQRPPAATAVPGRERVSGADAAGRIAASAGLLAQRGYLGLELAGLFLQLQRRARCWPGSARQRSARRSPDKYPRRRKLAADMLLCDTGVLLAAGNMKRSRHSAFSRWIEA